MRLSLKTFAWSDALLLCLIGVLYIYVLKLGTPHAVYLWDESIYANNSLEMERSGNYLVYTVDGVVDHHNSKPPLVLWMQVLSYKIFGYNELALRAPTYLALLATLALCILYSRRLTGNIRTGIVACLVILVTHGLIRPHVFLSGDLDGMLVFFCTAVFLHHLGVVQRQSIRPRDIYVYLALFIAGFFTKSTAILLILPSVLLSWLAAGLLKQVLINRASYLSVLLFIAVAAGYYGIREHFDPGYWDVVWSSEFTRVAVNVQPWLVYPWNVYFMYLRDDFFRYPLRLLAVIGPVYLVLPRLPHRKLFLHALLLAFVYLWMITIPPVKLLWYDAPVYPILAFGIGMALTGVFGYCADFVTNRVLREGLWIVVVTGLTSIAFFPFQKQVKAEVYQYLEPEETTFALREFSRAYDFRSVRVIEQIRKAKFIHALDGLRFYQKILRIQSGRAVKISGYVADVRSGETVIACKQGELDSLLRSGTAQVVDSCRSCKLIQLR